MAHKGKINWETKVYDRSGLGGRGPGKGAAGRSAGTHIWTAHTDTRPVIKFFFWSGSKLFSAIKGILITSPECFIYRKWWCYSPKFAQVTAMNSDYIIHTDVTKWLF